MRSSKKQSAAVYLLIVTAACIIYLQLIDFGLAAHDDFVNYNYFIASLRQNSFLHTVFAPVEHFSYWVPVTHLSYIMDFVLWGESSGKHHLSSLFFHMINGLLLFAFFKKTSRKIWPGAIIAIFLIVHPLNVEAVAFWAPRSIVICSFFVMLALHTYVEYTKTNRPGWYFLVIICFILGLLSNPTIIYLPLILLVLDYWPLKRCQQKTVVENPDQVNYRPFLLSEGFRGSGFVRLTKEKIPLFLIAALCIIGNSFYSNMFYAKSDYFQTYIFPNIPYPLQQLVASPQKLSLLIKQIPNAFVSYWGYVWKTIWPTNLSWYLPVTSGKTFSWWEIVGSLFLLTTITVIAIKVRKKAPYLLAGWLWFLIAISPSVANNTVLGNYIRDHYAYFPAIGLYIVFVWGGAALWTQFKYKKAALTVISAAIIVVFIFMSWRQTTSWRNPFTLYKHALTIEPESAFLHNNLGKALYENGNITEAIHHFEQALKVMPDSSMLLANLGTAYYAKGIIEQAEACLRKAMTLNPSEITAGRKLGLLYSAIGEYDKAAMVYKKLLISRPDLSAEICYNLACIYAIQEQPEVSVSWLKQSVAGGFNQIDRIKNDCDLNNIRHTEYYNELVERKN